MHTAEPPMALEDERQVRTGALCAGDAAIANWLHTIGRLCRSCPRRSGHNWLRDGQRRALTNVATRLTLTSLNRSIISVCVMFQLLVAWGAP